MIKRKTIKLVLLFAMVVFLLLSPAQASNTISANSSSNGSSFELVSSVWTGRDGMNLSISTSAGTTIVVATVEARMNSTGAKLLGRILRDGVEINRVNLTESVYITNIPIVAVRTETEGTHYYALELKNPTGKKTFVNNWTLGVTYVANGAYITEGITNATALINVTQVNGLRGEQDAQNASTANLQYNSTVYNTKFDNQNTTSEVLKVNDTTHDTKFNNQNTTNEQLRVNDTTDRAYLNNTFPGSTVITTLGTIITGIWHGTTIEDAYIASSALWNSYAGKIDANNVSISNLQYNSTVTDTKFNNTNASLAGINGSVNSSNYNDTVHDQKFNNTNASLNNIIINNTAQASYDNVTFLTITTANSMNGSSHNNRTYFQGVTDSINNTKANKTEVVGEGTTNQMNISSANNRTYFQALADLFNLTFGLQAQNNSNVNASFASQAINNSNFNASFEGINSTLAMQAINNSNVNASLAQIVVNNSAQASHDNNTFVKMNNGSYLQINSPYFINSSNTSILRNSSVHPGANVTVYDFGNGSIRVSAEGASPPTSEFRDGDGVTMNFTMLSPMIATTTGVYINGLRQRQGALGSYTVDNDVIRFASAPPLYDVIEVVY